MVDTSYIIISIGWLVGRLKRKEMIHMTNLLQRKRGFEEVESQFLKHKKKQQSCQFEVIKEVQVMTSTLKKQ